MLCAIQLLFLVADRGSGSLLVAGDLAVPLLAMLLPPILPILTSLVRLTRKGLQLYDIAQEEARPMREEKEEKKEEVT